MKISAIDIRKHTFEKIFRGYDPDEVDAFLNSLSQEWERYTSENGLLKMQLEYAEKELSKLKDIESTLFRTLKTAEDASKQIEKEANDNAERRIEEAQNAANALVAEAEARTSQVIQETEEKLKRFKEEFASEIKVQERDFRAIENFRDNLIVQLSSLANSAMDTVDRFEQKYDKESVLNKMEQIKQHVAEIEIPKKPAFEPPVMTQDIVSQEEETIEEEEREELQEIEVVEQGEYEAEMVQEEPSAEVVNEVFEDEIVEESVPSAAEQAEEALAQLQKARNEAPVNKPRTYENTPAPKQGGGSFFDQI